MKWIKKGIIFKANEHFTWMSCYTTPVAAIVLDTKIRVFFSTRSKADIKGNFISYVSFLDVDKNEPNKILYLHDKSLIKLGEPGTFDEFGTMVAKPVMRDKKIYLYYMGWQRLSGITAPYQVTIGLAISHDFGLTFSKVSNGPIIGIDYFDPISIGNVSVIIDEGLWKIWYTSYTKWKFGGKKPTPDYIIKYAESDNGIFWQKKNIIAIHENEFGGVATPSVIKKNDQYHMWFGYRPPFDNNGNIHGYKIGYANSFDGEKWERNDAASSIYTSENGWDSEMICYPHVVESDGKVMMFYCGNKFGLEGFGYAELQGELK